MGKRPLIGAPFSHGTLFRGRHRLVQAAQKQAGQEEAVIVPVDTVRLNAEERSQAKIAWGANKERNLGVKHNGTYRTQ